MFDLRKWSLREKVYCSGQNCDNLKDACNYRHC
jgi:hypothetical protein